MLTADRRLLTLKLAAAKGEQVEKYILYFPSLCLCGEIPLRAALKEIAIRRRHWPASFLWSSPANAAMLSAY